MSSKIEVNDNLNKESWCQISLNIPEDRAPAIYLQELSEVMGRRFRLWSDDGTRIIYETNAGLPLIVLDSPIPVPIEAIEKATEYMRTRTANNIKDSGTRQEFESGAVRDTQAGKPRFDLIPPEVLRLLALHYANGSEKYEERNWEKGQPIDRYVASYHRHVNAWELGEDDEPHLIAAIWNLFAILHHEMAIQEGRLPETLVGERGVLAREKRDRHNYLKSLKVKI